MTGRDRSTSLGLVKVSVMVARAESLLLTASCVVMRKPLSARNKGSDHSSVHVHELIMHPRDKKNRT